MGKSTRWFILFCLWFSSIAAQDSPELYKARRKALLNNLGKKNVAIFKAAPVARRNGDVDYEYRQDSDFYYLTGFEEPEAILVLSPRGIYVRDESKFVKEILFLRKRDPRMEVWEGYRLGVERAKSVLGVQAALPIDRFDDYLPALLQNIDTLYIKTKPVGLDEPLSKEMDFIRRARERLYDFAVAHPGKFLNRMREVKDSTELALLQKAIDITCEAHREAMKAARPGMFEYQLEAVIEYIFKKNGSERTGFPSIIGSGPNSCILHYNTNRRQMQDGDMVVIDIGAEYGMYTADITRTIPVNGKFSDAQREIYTIVLEAQNAGIAAAKVGASFWAPAQAAVRKVVEGLIRIGILKGDVETNIRNGTYRAFFMHGTSHHIGLDVHDVSSRGPLKANQVITVEPGIYISEATGRKHGVPPKYWNIGVRIEDDILITEEGPKILSKGAPRTIEEIEKLMSKSSNIH